MFAYVLGGAIDVPGGGDYREFLIGGIAEVVTGDRKDLRRLVTASGRRIRLHET